MLFVSATAKIQNLKTLFHPDISHAANRQMLAGPGGKRLQQIGEFSCVISVSSKANLSLLEIGLKPLTRAKCRSGA